MADKIDQLKIGTTSYDIDLPPDATPSISSLTASGAITGNTIVKSGGTSSQFLKADGSVDSSVYVNTANVNQDIDGIKTFTNRPRSVEVYTRYERIKSSAATGFPYIRTGVLRGVHYSTKLTCILEGYFNSSQTYGFCGYDSGGQLGQKSGKWSTENDGLGTTNVNCIGVANKATVKQVLDFSNSTNKLYIGSTMIAGRSISNTAFSQQADYPIFVAYNGTYSYNPSTLVLYSFKMYDGDDTTGTLIRDFIPVKNANNEIGLLDLVERKFYRNQGTIAFTAENETGTLQIGGDLLASSDVQTVALTGSYNDLSDKPSISNATITIKQTGISDQTFTLNGSAKTITLADNNTNYYHSTGTWNDLTYTATANGGAPELKFTIPTGTTSTTVAAGNHTHSTMVTTSSTLSSNTIPLGNGSKTLKSSSYKVATNSTTWNDTSNVYLPTMYAIANYVNAKSTTIEIVDLTNA